MSELKPFDLERAKAGDPFAYHASINPMYYICVLDDGQIAFKQKRIDGLCGVGCSPPENLGMLPRKVKRWHVITRRNSFNCETAAYNAAAVQIASGCTAHVIQHEWEE